MKDLLKKKRRQVIHIKKITYGFYPQRPLRDYKWDKNEYHLTDLLDFAEKSDAVYFADTYGVFFQRLVQGDHPRAANQEKFMADLIIMTSCL